MGIWSLSSSSDRFCCCRIMHTFGYWISKINNAKFEIYFSYESI
jgi:hypothetical protein